MTYSSFLNWSTTYYVTQTLTPSLDFRMEASNHAYTRRLYWPISSRQCSSLTSRYKVRILWLQAIILTHNLVDQVAFFSVLNDAGGAITGSSTLKVTRPYIFRSNSAKNLNLVVPKGQSTRLLVFLVQHGYFPRMLKIKPVFLGIVHSCVHFVHHSSKQSIIVAESFRESILGVILESKNSSTMNLITARNIYSFYPVFSAKNLAYSGYIDHSPADESSAAAWGIFLTSPGIWQDIPTTGCGDECPRIVRRMSTLDGIGLVCWNQNGREKVTLTQQRFYWTLGPTCKNPNCRYVDWRYMTDE